MKNDIPVNIPYSKTINILRATKTATFKPYQLMNWIKSKNVDFTNLEQLKEFKRQP
jgi:hypothetical protein